MKKGSTRLQPLPLWETGSWLGSRTSEKLLKIACDRFASAFSRQSVPTCSTAVNSWTLRKCAFHEVGRNLDHLVARLVQAAHFDGRVLAVASELSNNGLTTTIFCSPPWRWAG